MNRRRGIPNIANHCLRVSHSTLARSVVLFVVVASASALLFGGTARSTPAPGFPGQRPSAIRLSLDPSHSTVHFTLGATAHTVHGEFKLTRGEVSFDPADGKLTGEVVVDARSGDSGSSGRDSKMHQEILESDRYPEISFHPERAEGFSATAGKLQGTVHGTFMIHGGSHEVSAPVTVDFSTDRWSATANFVVPYVDWGLKNPSTFLLRVAKSVDVEVQASGSLTRKTP
jgi:polyisoprenoid-binding protein YceI